jgi:hypothetical protein
MSNFYKEVDIMDTCFKEDVWNAKPNFTCYKYCPVVHCPHNLHVINIVQLYTVHIMERDNHGY